MIRKLVRTFTQYKFPQPFEDFTGSLKSDTVKLKELPLESMNKKALTFRNMEIEDYDFETETSDFDTERFNFKEYLWSVIFYRDRTLMRLYSFMLAWSIILLFSRALWKVIKNIALKTSPIGYFGLVEPAYNDIELERCKQRIRFNILHSFD